MKKILSVLIVLLMSMNLSASAATTTGTVKNQTKIEKVSVPKNIIVKQTITMDDGTTIELFYKKEGEQCKLYSTTNLNKFGITDLYCIKSTNFEKTDHVEGKCYVNRTIGALIKMVKRYIK